MGIQVSRLLAPVVHMCRCHLYLYPCRSLAVKLPWGFGSWFFWMSNVRTSLPRIAWTIWVRWKNVGRELEIYLFCTISFCKIYLHVSNLMKIVLGGNLYLPSWQLWVHEGATQIHVLVDFNSWSFTASLHLKAHPWDWKMNLRKLQQTPGQHTPDPQLPVDEGNPVIFVSWDTWGPFQRSVGFFLEWSFCPFGVSVQFFTDLKPSSEVT